MATNEKRVTCNGCVVSLCICCSSISLLGRKGKRVTCNGCFVYLCIYCLPISLLVRKGKRVTCNGCFVFLSFLLLCVAVICIALLCLALLCFALPCFALLALLCLLTLHRFDDYLHLLLLGRQSNGPSHARPVLAARRACGDEGFVARSWGLFWACTSW